MTKRTSSAPGLADPLALEEQVCFALSVAARSVVAVYRPLLEPMGLTHPQYLVMLALWQHAPLSGRDLSRLLQLDPGHDRFAIREQGRQIVLRHPDRRHHVMPGLQLLRRFRRDRAEQDDLHA